MGAFAIKTPFPGPGGTVHSNKHYLINKMRQKQGEVKMAGLLSDSECLSMLELSRVHSMRGFDV
jgi:hypothetical protein